jgi:hypothetical protein
MIPTLSIDGKRFRCERIQKRFLVAPSEISRIERGNPQCSGGSCSVVTADHNVVEFFETPIDRVENNAEQGKA